MTVTSEGDAVAVTSAGVVVIVVYRIVVSETVMIDGDSEVATSWGPKSELKAWRRILPS